MRDTNDHWIDRAVRDGGRYRRKPVRDIGDDLHVDSALRSECGTNDMEEAMVEALDAGLTAEEIADIQLGSL